ncbi:GMC family oxidoreductase N-terminal domain-containing protein [Pseudomonas sp. LS1212]|uniref:GMC family oxidoreductase n=1 Tax=Pseudomonas sp. LS1212 TaxID=2972478 RepID=UPI00215D0B76|nr:GMC family oxidoreductase N-terminal domain-containing protein [Pseudomonas sp. LS1212]UVJ45712.1 GMC family oxidoreductase N-terminal domain-containing protein [Pseudomonas sp. LS1212]
MNTFDFIIVGAGSAGCVLANRLSADPSHRVLLLEAGRTDNMPYMSMPLAFRNMFTNPAIDWGYVSEPEPYADNRRLPVFRGKVLGGCSSVNGMLYARGHSRDYDEWRDMGLKGWGYEDVLPYFRRSECNWRGTSRFHGGEGLMGVSRHQGDAHLYDDLARTAQRLGHRSVDNFHGEDQEGFGAPDFTVAKGRRASTSQAFLHPVRARHNLVVRTGCMTTRVLFKGHRAIGVEYIEHGQRHQVFTDREVILSGGAFNSPQLLMLSGIGPALSLRKHGIDVHLDLPGVGQSLQDHHSIRVEFAANGPIAFDSQLRYDRLARSVIQWKLFGTGPAAGLPVSGMLFYHSEVGLDRPDGQTLISPVAGHAKVWYPLVGKGVGHQLSTANVCLRPDSKGHVQLRSADPLAKPAIQFNLLQAESDRLFFRRAVRGMREFFATQPAARLVSHELVPGTTVQSDSEIDQFVRSMIGTAFHPAGTCAMGLGADAVVDAGLSVHGIEGLRVADASVMPRIVGGNTNAPVIMIAEKAADLILCKPVSSVSKPELITSPMGMNQ